jgi:hypothetical protein
MNQSKYLFAQITDFLPYYEFLHIVKKHDGDKGIREFSCWNQLMMMLFGQLSGCESMRDLCILADAHHRKAYRLGFGKGVSLSTLSRANAGRDYRIFEEFAGRMIARAQACRARAEFDLPVEGSVYAFDSSTISLCLNVFWWTSYKQKLHLRPWIQRLCAPLHHSSSGGIFRLSGAGQREVSADVQHRQKAE